MKHLIATITLLSALMACHPQEPQPEPTWVSYGFALSDLMALTAQSPAILDANGDTLLTIETTHARAFECYLPGEIAGQAFVRVSDSSGGMHGLLSDHKAGDRRMIAWVIEVAAIPQADSVWFDAEIAE